MKLAELGVPVDCMSLTPVKRSHSVCAQGGINSVNETTRQQGDSEWLHLDDTVYGGDFLQHQPPVKEMTDWAPRIIDLMDRLGVTFNRTAEGFRDQRRFGGTLFMRTAFAGATTGQQLLYALDEQVRRRHVEGLVTMYEGWDFLSPVVDDDGRCRGAIAQNLVTMEIRAFPADAVILATGGCGLIYGRSTMSMACTGSAAGRREVCQRRVHPGPPHGDTRVGQVPVDERVGPRRGRPRLGATHAARSASAPQHPRRGAVLFSRRALPEVR
jgi:succinate dehydrogenase / fumarate reductase flavoprotein subunit